jgi:hypothetical protein
MKYIYFVYLILFASVVFSIVRFIQQDYSGLITGLFIFSSMTIIVIMKREKEERNINILIQQKIPK